MPYGVAAAGSTRQGITGAEATIVADLAFSAWKDASCEGGTPNIQPYDDGPLTSVPEASDCLNSDSCDPETHDVIVFDDEEWPYPTNTANTIALTTVSYGVDDGRIFEAKTEVNSADEPLSTAEPTPSDDYDLRAVLTHEAGHFFGLAHATETTSVMFAYYQAPGLIQLTPDDVSGICTVYPPPGPQTGFSPTGFFCSSAPARRRSSSGAAIALIALFSCCAVRRRRRSR
jgi:hypothetical protein